MERVTQNGCRPLHQSKLFADDDERVMYGLISGKIDNTPIGFNQPEVPGQDKTNKKCKTKDDEEQGNKKLH